MGGSLGGRAAKARNRALRVLAAAGLRFISLLSEVNCVWAPDLYGQILLERRQQQWEDPPPGHPEVLRPEVPPSAAEKELWSRLGPGWTWSDDS